MYHTLKDQLVNTTEEIDVAQLKETSIQNEIQRQLQKEAEEFGLSFDILQSAMNEYQSDKKTIPYLTHLLDSMTLSKEEFEAKTGEKYRRRTKVLEERLQQNFEQLQKWKGEL
ncbi:type I restriction endonuclease subunit R, partial [Streptococcus thermophilus]